MQEIDSVRRFTTVERQGREGGSDFLSFVGTRAAWQVVDLQARVSGGKTNEVAFEVVGLRLDQSDVIKALNQDTTTSLIYRSTLYCIALLPFGILLPEFLVLVLLPRIARRSSEYWHSCRSCWRCANRRRL